MVTSEVQALMDAAVDAVILIGHDGRITAFNRSAERLFGYGANEMLGRNVSELMPEPYRGAHDDYISRYEQSGVAHIIGLGREVEAQRKDGSCFPAFLTVGKVEGSQPMRYVGFVRDVTPERQALAHAEAERDRARERENAQLEARRLQERLTHVSRMATMGEMAAGIAHEINQPLSAIATYARACERLLDAPEQDTPEIRSALQEISSEALRAGYIIRRLRQLVAEQPEKQERLQLNGLVKDLGVLMQADSRVHRAMVHLDLSPDLPPIVAERVQLQQLVLSLVRNAIEALTEKPEAERAVTIRTAYLQGEGCVELSVEDNGPGVRADVVERLFMPFATTKPTGTGLGLAISQTIAQAHGGTVGHRPRAPSGACFFVRLPVKERSA